MGMFEMKCRSIPVGDTVSVGDRVLILRHLLVGMVTSVDSEQRSCKVRVEGHGWGEFSFDQLFVEDKANGESA